VAYLDATTRLGPGGSPRSPVSFSAAAASAVITGTASSGLLEAELVSGGQTIIITLANDTWAAAGTGPIGSTADTQALIDGLDAASSPALGWNDEIRDKEVTTAVVRTSDTIATITLTASALYSIADLATETVTLTIPAATLVTSAIDVTATPTFDVAADAVVVATTAKGGGKKRKRYVVEVDGQLIQVASVQEAESVLQQVRDLAEQSALKDVQTEVVPKPPRVSVKTISGKASTSKTIQAEVKKTQRVINTAYIKQADANAQNREISELLIKKIEFEDEEETKLILLM